MKYRNRLFAVGCVLACLICGCKSKKNTPEEARLKGDVYTNSFFGFQMQIPRTWTVLDKPSKYALRKGAEALGADKKAAAAAADAAEEVHYLLLARNVVLGESIGVSAQNVARNPSLRTGKDFLEQTLQMMTGAGKPLRQVNPVAPVKIASREFYRVDIEGDVMGQKQHQAMFVTIEKGHALAIIVGARSETAVDDVLAGFGVPIARKEVATAPKKTPPVVTQD